MAVLRGDERFTAIDIATLVYVAATTAAVFILADGDRPVWIWLLGAHALVVVLVWLAPQARGAGPFGQFVGDWYPFLIMGALYAEVGVLNLDAGFQHDLAIQRLEEWVFGSQVSYRWIRAMPSPALSWIMHGCYLLYYAMLLAVPLALWVTRRRTGARFTILAVSTTFYVCYLVFLVFPVAGPRYAFPLAHNAATGVGAARLAQWLLDTGDSWGAAFPSSHVAATVVATVCAWRAWRPLGFALLPITVGLVLGVVYGQFHYGVDALSGLAIAALVLASLNGRLVSAPADL